MAAQVGGLRTLNCLSLLAAAAWTLPAGLWLVFHGRSSIRPPRASLPILVNSSLCALSTVTVHLYTESYLSANAGSLNHLKAHRLVFAFVCSAALSFLRGDMQVMIIRAPLTHLQARKPIRRGPGWAHRWPRRQ